MQFGNDKSKIIRGIAIVLMVAGHSCPGKIIPFAAPLFSFLVGYGYEYAKQKDFKTAFRRIWHLLSHFWFILFAICVPLAVCYTHYKFSAEQLVLNMFGLWPGFNYYCWYVYFYILAMLAMPLLSRIIDRYGLKAVIPMCAVSLGIFFLLEIEPNQDAAAWLGKNWSFINKFGRFFKYMPVVLSGYWFAHNHIFDKVKIRPGVLVGIISLTAAVGIYFLRGLDTYKVLDLLWTPLFAGVMAITLDSMQLAQGIIGKAFGYLKVAITEFGNKSMHIWFLHSLFYAHSTKGVFAFMKPMMGNDMLRVVTVFIASWLISVATMKLFDLLSNLLGRMLAFGRGKKIFRLGSGV